MKKIIVCFIITIVSRICVGNNGSLTNSNIVLDDIENKLIELVATIKHDEFYFYQVSNDLNWCNQFIENIEVPDAIVKTNIIRTGNFTITKIKTIKLSKLQKNQIKIDKMLKSEKYQLIYCKYFPDTTFSELKNDFLEQMSDIEMREKNIKENKHNRRKTTDEKIKERDRQLENAINELNLDLDRCKMYLRKSPHEIGYKIIQSMCDRYDCTSANIISTIRSRLFTLEQLRRDNISSVIRSEANGDNDDISEFSIETAKNDCVRHFLDKINIISDLRLKLKQIKDRVENKWNTYNNYVKLKSVWNELDIEQKTTIKNKIIKDLMDKAYGEGTFEESYKNNKRAK